MLAVRNAVRVVIVAEPAARKITRPFTSTVATAGFEDVHVKFRLIGASSYPLATAASCTVSRASTCSAGVVRSMRATIGSTVMIDEDQLTQFVEATGVAMVMGYTKLVDWTEGAVMDLLLLRWLQYYRDLGALWKHLLKNYPDLMELTGLQAFPALSGGVNGT